MSLSALALTAAIIWPPSFFAAGCAGLGLMIGFWSWLTWRFVAGVGCAMIWVVVESALMCSGTSRNRGRLLAAYMMVYYVGTF